MEIKEIQSKNPGEYKTFFLNGLFQDEVNFRISPNDEKEAEFPTMDTADSFTLGAFEDNQLAGVVSFQREGKNREKLRHKGLLFRMYVDSHFRGKGIAQLLINNLIERIEMLEGIEQINLTVVSNNLVAKKLYEKFGFTFFAVEKNALKWKEQYYDEEQMVLFINKKNSIQN